MNPDIVHASREVRKSIELRFVLAPVVCVTPVGDELLQVVDVGACAAASALDLVRPARVLQSLVEVTQDLWSDVDFERVDCIGFHEMASA